MRGYQVGAIYMCHTNLPPIDPCCHGNEN